MQHTWSKQVSTLLDKAHESRLTCFGQRLRGQPAEYAQTKHGIQVTPELAAQVQSRIRNEDVPQLKGQ